MGFPTVSRPSLAYMIFSVFPGGKLRKYGLNGKNKMDKMQPEPISPVAFGRKTLHHGLSVPV